jgi:hypothetical protein
MKVCPSKLNSNILVFWHKITHVVVGKTNDGWKKKMFWVDYCETRPGVLIEYLTPKLQDFVRHNSTPKWHEKEFKAYVPNLPPNIVVSCIDFS